MRLTGAVRDDRIVLVEFQAECSDHANAGIAREPSGGNEPDGVQSQPREQRKSPFHPFPGGRGLERQKLSLPSRLPECAPLITPSSWRSDLVVTLAVEKYLGAVFGPRPYPLHEVGIALQGPVPVPIRYNE